LNSQNKDNKKSKHYKDCLCGESHLFINCPYLFTEVRKSDWNLKPEVEKKVKEALTKAPERIKGALERAKAELEKKASTTETPPTSTKPSTFVVQHCAKPGNFMLAYSKHHTSTPESYSQRTPYKSTESPVILDPLRPDTDSLRITTQSVISLKSSAFRVTSTSTGQQYMLNNSFILDSRATCYIYNNKSKFTNLRITSDDDVLYTRESIILIEGFGTMAVTVTTIEEPTQYTPYLYNVVLISSFYTSIASLRLFIAQRVH